MTKPIAPVALLLLLPMLALGACSGDCEWSGHGEAWIDENENGVWDGGETPLQGVIFRLGGVPRAYIIEGQTDAVSDLDGSASLNVVMVGCPDFDLYVYVEVPSGYGLTTEDRKFVDTKNKVARFGLAPIEGQK